MRDLRDPVKLGERLVELHRVRQRIHASEQIGRARMSEVYDENERELARIEEYDATHQGPLEKYGDPRA